MRVGVDDRRHHRFPGEADARGARRYPDIGGGADLRKAAILYDEAGVLDGCASVADDDARAFEHRHPGRGRRLTARRRGPCRDHEDG
jgi:hypothetical protein